MSENSLSSTPSTPGRPDFNGKGSRFSKPLFLTLLAAGLLFAGLNLFKDVEETGTAVTSYVPFLLLGLALLIALGFEFINGFHDTANAVATVIYTRSLMPGVAVIWSGICNFLGVLLSSGVVAFGIISLLPVELILQTASNNGFAMIYALLFSAIIWNLSTWYFGLPSSSSHTLIGSVIGVGVANAMLQGLSWTTPRVLSQCGSKWWWQLRWGWEPWLAGAELWLRWGSASAKLILPMRREQAPSSWR